jgi:hypothetical protein
MLEQKKAKPIAQTPDTLIAVRSLSTQEIRADRSCRERPTCAYRQQPQSLRSPGAETMVLRFNLARTQADQERHPSLGRRVTVRLMPVSTITEDAAMMPRGAPKSCTTLEYTTVTKEHWAPVTFRRKI